MSQWNKWVCVSGLLSFGVWAQAQTNTAATVLHQPGMVKPFAPSAINKAITAQRPRSLASTTENGRVCHTVTFEGVGNLAVVPPVEGINTPSWLAIIDADAGGSGNFAQEPSPQTIAFWLGGNPGSRDIVFDNLASKVEFFYTSAVTVTAQALDANGVALGTVSGGPNLRMGTGDPTGDFNAWTPLKLETTGNKIKTVRVTGNSNQTGIDDLKVCTTLGIESIELTQAIQQYQPIKDLKTSLQSGREPPVPMVAGKQTALRVYMQKVDSVTPVKVQLSGAVNQTKSLVLQPQCQPEDRRRRKNGCQSIDFFFSAPSDSWDITAKVLDQDGNVIESHDLPLKSRKTDALKLKAVGVCDAVDASGNWQCESAAQLSSKMGLLRKIAPSNSVTLEVTSNVVQRNTASYSSANSNIAWWTTVASDVDAMYGFFEGIGDWASNRHTTYYGMARPNVTGSASGIGGIAHGLPSRGALSRSSAPRLGVETSTEVVAHETGHTLGLKHTNLANPASAGSPPGCYNTAADSSTDWNYPSNSIQSSARLEVGFDVVANTPLMPETTFDIMSYCTPRWISPQRYKRMIEALSGGSVSSASLAASNKKAVAMKKTGPRNPMAMAPAPAAWVVSGTFVGNGVSFDPLFDDGQLVGNDEGVGTHRIEVQNASGAMLAQRRFTPAQAHAESTGDVPDGPSTFFAMVPVVANAARLVVYDAVNNPVGSLNLTGAKPTVTWVQPTGGVLSGQRSVSWTVADADSSRHASKVYYSGDNGNTWALVGRNDSGTSARINFDALPGAAGVGRLMVSVSDGVNSASAVSPAFDVPKKALTDVRIDSPQPNQVFAQGVPVYMDGSAYDVDDGLLADGAIVWKNASGAVLGTGAQLSVDRLPKGPQTITMVATDKDGNSASRSVNIRVAGDAPSLTLNVSGLDQLPTTCVETTIDAKADVAGVNLSKVEYSLTGGNSWINVPTNRLPFKFMVPGSGYVHLIARTFDEAGQSDAKESRFFINSACAAGGTPALGGTVQGQGVAAPGVQYVDVRITNNGQGVAKAVKLNAVLPRVLGGTGVVSYNTSQSPALPLALPDLAIGDTTTVRLYFNVPATVTRFGITENGSLTDKFGRAMTFSAAQSVIPSK